MVAKVTFYFETREKKGFKYHKNNIFFRLAEISGPQLSGYDVLTFLLDTKTTFRLTDLIHVEFRVLAS